MYEAARGPKSKWYGYLASLPDREYLPVYWSDVQLERLEGCEMAGKAQQDREAMAADFASELEPLLERYPLRLGPLRAGWNLEAFMRAASWVASRAFYVDERHGDALVPLADAARVELGGAGGAWAEGFVVAEHADAQRGQQRPGRRGGQRSNEDEEEEEEEKEGGSGGEESSGQGGSGSDGEADGSQDGEAESGSGEGEEEEEEGSALGSDDDSRGGDGADDGAEASGRRRARKATAADLDRDPGDDGENPWPPPPPPPPPLPAAGTDAGDKAAAGFGDGAARDRWGLLAASAVERCGRNIHLDIGICALERGGVQVLDIVAAQPLAEGAEVFNTYGEHGNAELVNKYGFALPCNPFDEVSLDKDELMAAAEAELGRKAAQRRAKFLRKHSELLSPEEEPFLLLPPAHVSTPLYLALRVLAAEEAELAGFGGIEGVLRPLRAAARRAGQPQQREARDEGGNGAAPEGTCGGSGKVGKHAKRRRGARGDAAEAEEAEEDGGRRLPVKRPRRDGPDGKGGKGATAEEADDSEGEDEDGSGEEDEEDDLPDDVEVEGPGATAAAAAAATPQAGLWTDRMRSLLRRAVQARAAAHPTSLEQDQEELRRGPPPPPAVAGEAGKKGGRGAAAKQKARSGIDLSELVVASGPKQKTAKKGTVSQQAEPQPQLSKSQLRKLKQVQLKKERRENISQVLASLHTHAASDTALALMRPLHQRGHRETKKQRLRRELQMQRAGLAAPPAADGSGSGGGGELLRRRTVKGAGSGSDSEGGEERGSGSESNDESEEEEGPETAPMAGLPHRGAASSEDAGDSGSDCDGDGEEGGPAGGPAAKKQRTQPQQPAATAAAAATVDPAAARREALHAVRREAERIRAQELGGVDERLGDPTGELAAARAQAAAAAAAAAAFPHRVVHVARPAAMVESRSALPISGQEADIMEAVAAHDVIVLAGETGCGKTTQVPQFLYEAGYGCRDFPEKAGAVGITQPRRVAAVSTAQRVAEELGCAVGETVGYQVRYDRSVGDKTALKFMTDGILLRELQLDFSLAAYSAIIVDEAHERGLNTDLLLGMLSRAVPLRRRLWRERQEALARGERPAGPPVYPLKLIIMSATLRTSDFTENKRLFPKPPPVINVPARQYPVTVHFSRRTELRDYVSAAFRKVTRIHAELPPGGILVFLTGQREVEQLCRRLRHHYAERGRRAAAAAAAASGGGARGRGSVAAAGAGCDDGGDDEGGGDGCGVDEEDPLAAGEQYGGGGDVAEVAGDAAERRRRSGPEEEEVDDYQAGSEMNGEDEEGDEDEEEVQVMGGEQFTPEEIAEAERRFEEAYGRTMLPGAAGGAGGAGAAGAPGEGGGPGPVHVLPLYAMLPQARQAKVFAAHPPGTRLIIVATNVAETSLTIPGIRYVVDAGRSKQKLLEGAGAGGGTVARYDVRWVSKASAQQRAGRAGRTCPGHAYRLFSSAHFNDTFPEHSPPEILNSELEGVVLVMKAMGVDKVHNFPFPTPPDPDALRGAHRCLEALCALEPGSGRLTELGRAMAAFPISPRHARMLLEVLKWHKSLQGGADAVEGGTAGSSGGGALAVPEQVARRAGRALPYAVALAAALSIESPFIHIDTVGGDGEGEGGSGSGAGEGGRRADAEGGEEEEEGADGGRGGRKKRRGGQEPEQRQSQEEGDAGDLGVQEGEDEDGDEDGGGDGRRRKSAGAAGLGPGSARAAQAAAAAREAARRRRAHAAAMQGRFRHEASDALSALAALLAFEASGESEEFASRHFLHARNLREAADLHRQLLRVLALQQAGAALGPAATAGGAAAAAGGTLAEELAAAAREIVAAMAVPTATAAEAAVGGAGRGAAAAAAAATTAAEAALSGPAASAAAGVAALLPERVAAVLRRALAAGWADQVARRMRSAEYLAQLGESRRKRHAVRYQPACVGVAADAGGGDEGGGDDAAVFLHPRSALHAAAPELLVYCSLLRTDKRPYMVGLTSIEAEWLAESGTPLCVLSAGVLPDPAPAYKGPPVDGVVAWREAAYGLHAWPLPPVAAPHPDAAERAAVFGAALLEGRVLPGLAELRPLLAASPAMMLRPELRGVARVGELVGALSRRRIDSRRSLAAAWAADPTALQRELAAWVSKHQQALLLRLWPRLLQEAAAPAAAGAERKQQQQQRKERGREGKAAAPAASGGKNAKKKAGKA
ncbi:hypothetical protein GPECTOR_6g650 [Gonium pectorale]|uniref:RNA helicase n=1 Tax=Gonium pectorale TaxID=33097 RepID=A0A150GVE5_GONPE|nr:hypothetical protein GPECTOR_6g650 [Gonium pectorale]|eukprot:KXZ53733.1 hypothetical protein GPECTOR_6g650 [Gonium pectorale]